MAQILTGQIIDIEYTANLEIITITIRVGENVDIELDLWANVQIPKEIYQGCVVTATVDDICHGHTTLKGTTDQILNIDDE